LYAYRVGALRRITAMAPSTYENTEKLEQLRALQAGLRITVALCAERPGPGIDTDADLQRARSRAAHEPGARRP
jgi:3-deoxy-manno-octulosonate cytidylyltransferase (CMP-KDO synthetase)